MASVASQVKQAGPVAPVVCVDLDGTLIASDLLSESILGYSRRHPLGIFHLPFWLLRGRAYLKQRLANPDYIRPENLPYRQDVLETISALREAGATRTVLATASHVNLANAVARHLGIFDEVVATCDATNLKGAAKAQALEARFGHDYLYIGDHTADLSVWASARQGVVAGGEGLAQRAARVTQVVARLNGNVRQGVKGYWRAMRPHHWSKNILLFLPLLLAHISQPEAWLRVLLGTLLFGLGASGIYVINDLLDLTSDRQHPWKCLRPFASGGISIARGMALGPALLAVGIGLGTLLLGYPFGLALAVYCALSLSYSLVLKRKALIDVFLLTSFYGIRIITGALINHTPLSHWFLIFCMFFFFSLALAKRYSELMHAKALIDAGNSGRGYRATDSQLLSTMGVASAFAAIIVFSFYTHSPAVTSLYPHPAPLLLIAPMLLYWLMRVWLRADRGELNEDPVLLAMRDPMSYVIGAASFLCILFTFFWR